jgi:hypothetical protein
MKNSFIIVALLLSSGQKYLQITLLPLPSLSYPSQNYSHFLTRFPNENISRCITYYPLVSLFHLLFKNEIVSEKVQIRTNNSIGKTCFPGARSN